MIHCSRLQEEALQRGAVSQASVRAGREGRRTEGSSPSALNA